MAAVDLQVAVTMCGSICRIVHIARVTPPSLASDALKFFDDCWNSLIVRLACMAGIFDEKYNLCNIPKFILCLISNN